MLAEDVGDVIGAEGAAGMCFHESLGDGLAAVEPDQLE